MVCHALAGAACRAGRSPAGWLAGVSPGNFVSRQRHSDERGRVFWSSRSKTLNFSSRVFAPSSTKLLQFDFFVMSDEPGKKMPDEEVPSSAAAAPAGSTEPLAAPGGSTEPPAAPGGSTEPPRPPSPTPGTSTEGEKPKQPTPPTPTHSEWWPPYCDVCFTVHEPEENCAVSLEPSRCK